tara:strand:- start:359 stop:1222 length:864 start_codon:yes stop_codon:yes gene_type:complete
MKNFKDMWEDAAANSVGNDGVDMPADVQHDKKKKKKAVYDGRTKEGRKFVEKMLARRKAKEINASKQNAASVSMKEETIEEAMNLKQLKQKFKGDIKKYETDGYFKNKKANQAFMDYAMDNGEIKTDDPDEFEAWMDRDVLESAEVEEGYAADKEKKQKATLAKHDKRMIKVARDSIKKYQDKKDTKEAKKPVSKMTPAEKAADAKRRKEYNAYQKSKRNETVEEAKAPKMKGLSLYGSEVAGLRAKDGKLYSAKPVVMGGKLAYRVTDEFGAFETLPLKKFAAKFG